MQTYSIAAAARELGISPTILRRWVNEAGALALLPDFVPGQPRQPLTSADLRTIQALMYLSADHSAYSRNDLLRRVADGTIPLEVAEELMPNTRSVVVSSANGVELTSAFADQNALALLQQTLASIADQHARIEELASEVHTQSTEIHRMKADLEDTRRTFRSIARALANVQEELASARLPAPVEEEITPQAQAAPVAFAAPPPVVREEPSYEEDEYEDAIEPAPWPKRMPLWRRLFGLAS